MQPQDLSKETWKSRTSFPSRPSACRDPAMAGLGQGASPKLESPMLFYLPTSTDYLHNYIAANHLPICFLQLLSWQHVKTLNAGLFPKHLYCKHHKETDADNSTSSGR